jgi:radical SAM-linked protein
MRFVSHLDLVRLFQRALRRAALPVTITKGFSPHLKVSITRALKLGLESEREEAVISLEELVGTEEFIKRINEQLPEGLTVTGAESEKK